MLPAYERWYTEEEIDAIREKVQAYGFSDEELRALGLRWADVDRLVNTIQ